MAQVPNYYYNSPYIADAARNLASALAPPDPDKTLARQKLAFEFQQEQEKARLAEQDRAELDIGRSYLAQLGALQPIIGPDGKVDREATFSRARELYSNAIANRVDPKAAEAVAGPFGPGFAAKSELAELGYGSRMNLLDATLAGAMSRDVFREGQLNARTVGNWQNQITLQDMRGWASYQSALARAANSQARRGAKVSVADLEQITFLIMARELQSDKKFYDDERDKLIDAAVEVFKHNGNHQGAVNAIWDATIGSNQRQENQPGKWDQWMGNDPNAGYLSPDLTKLAPFSTPDLGEVATGGGMPGGGPRSVTVPPGMVLPPNPVAAPPAPSRRPPRVPRGSADAAPNKPPAAGGKFKEGQRAKDKEGKDMIYRDGKWWYPPKTGAQ